MKLRTYITLAYLLGTGGSHAQLLRGIPEQASDLLQRELVVVVSSPSCYEVDKNCDGVDFTSVITASMWHSTLNDGSFVDTNWQGIGFGGSQAKNTDFTRANLRDAYVNHVSFDNAILRETDLSGANFDSTRFTGADLTSATYSEETVFASASFDHTTKFPDGNTWLETNFFTTDIKGMKLILDDQDVSGMDLSSRFSSFPSCSFSRMTAHGTSCQGCDLSQSSMWQLQAEAIDFSNAVLTNIPMHYSNIRRVNFGNAVLTGTGLKNCNMEDCNLVGADLSQADFDDSTNMLGCTYDDATLFPDGFDPLAHGLIDTYAPTGSPTLAPATSSPTPSPIMPNLEDLMSNTMVFDDIPCFPMGMNLASVLYYSNQFTFKNAFLESGGCCWPADTRVDADGNLLEVAPPDSTDYWIAGRNLIYRVHGQYPKGTYILHAEGNGTVNLAYDVGASQDVSVPTGPNGHAVAVNPSDGGVQLTITETSETDPVRNISFMYQEYQENNSSSPFTPTVMDTLSGMNVLRFMDMGRTNGNNIVHWGDRNTKISVSQSRSIKRVWDIDSVHIPAEQTALTDIFGLLIITTEPHGLVTGQVVVIENLEGQVVVSREGDSDLILDLSELWFPKLVEVTGPNTFLINIGNWDWDKITYSLSAISGASADRVVLEINPGVAYEYMIEMSKEAGADPWFCVPHLATDDYVREMAELIATSVLGPDVTVYVELSNEVWNTIFSQQWYVEAKRRELNLPSSSQYHGQRSKEVFEIFEAAFAAVPNAPVLNRVLATQSVNTWISEQVIIGAGGAGSFDSLAVAPYFSAHATDVFGRSTDGQSVTGVTVTDVLELCLEDIFGDNRRYVIAQKEVAEDYGGTLVAYEGGQHLGGQGNHPVHEGIRLEDDSDFQDLMIAANRDPRMHNLYQAYFRQWGELAGGVFAHFSFIGQPSKWGSFGVKESYYKADTVEESPKWVSVKGIADRCGAF